MPSLAWQVVADADRVVFTGNTAYACADADVTDSGNVKPGHIAKSSVSAARRFGQASKRRITNGCIRAASGSARKRRITNGGVRTAAVRAGSGVTKEGVTADGRVLDPSGVVC